MSIKDFSEKALFLISHFLIFLVALFAHDKSLAFEFLLNWFLIIMAYISISIGIILDLVEFIGSIRLSLIDFSILHLVSRELSDENPCIWQPNLSLPMQQCLLHLWWVPLLTWHISLLLQWVYILCKSIIEEVSIELIVSGPSICHQAEWVSPSTSSDTNEWPVV